MFKSSVVFLLIFSLLSANLSRYFVYVGFAFNRNYIAANLCENRDKPVMQCEGKCYLSKQLKQEAQKQKNQERESKKSSFHEAALNAPLSLTVASCKISVAFATDLPFVLPGRVIPIFHPPQV